MNLLPPSRTASAPYLRALILALLALTAASLACNLPGAPAGEPTQPESEFPLADAIYEEAGMSMAEALAVPPEDHRPGVLEQLGPPDAFTLEWEILEGQVVRWEEWSYFDFRSRFDFIDGELVWTLDIEPAPDGSIYAHTFDPLAFEPGMSMAEVEAVLPELEFTEFPLEEADIPGGVLMASDQILLGFDQDALVFVQTYMLTPDDPTVFSLEEPTQAPPITATSEAITPTETSASTTTPSGVLLHDTFDDPATSATPLFGADIMGFSVSGGSGTMTAHEQGVLVATYASPLVADFNAALTLRMPVVKPGLGAGLVFRSDNADGGLAYYYMLLVRPADGYVGLWRYQNSQMAEVKRSSLASPAIRAGEPITLALAASADVIGVYVNNLPAFTIQDSGLPLPGILGLALTGPGDGDQVIFDELRVEASND
jgi:hypothetical protein